MNIRIIIVYIIFFFFTNIIQEEARYMFALGILLYNVIKKRYVFLNNIYLFNYLLLVLFIGCIKGLDNLLIDYLRDVFNMSQMIIFFIIGLYLVHYIRNLEQLGKVFMGLGVISSLYHIHFFVIDPNLWTLSLEDIRNVVGKGSDVEIVCYPFYLLCIFNTKIRNMFVIKLKTSFWICFLFLSFSFFSYLSRTMILSSFVILLSLMNFINLENIRSNFKLLAIVVFAITVVYFLPTNLNSSGEFFNKFLNTKEELFSNRVSNFSEEDMNMNWRRYETFRGMLYFQKGTLVEKVLGFGCGTLVDLGTSIKLGSEQEFQKIPIFHNGYVYLLIKFGYLGIIAYVYFILRMAFAKMRSNSTIVEVFCKRLIEGICIITLLSTFTTSGLLNKNNFFITILLGFLWRVICHNKIVKPSSF